MRTPSWITQHLAAVRALVVLTVLIGIIYPFAITGDRTDSGPAAQGRRLDGHDGRQARSAAR